MKTKDALRRCKTIAASMALLLILLSISCGVRNVNTADEARMNVVNLSGMILSNPQGNFFSPFDMVAINEGELYPLKIKIPEGENLYFSIYNGLSRQKTLIPIRWLSVCNYLVFLPGNQVFLQSDKLDSPLQLELGNELMK